MQQDERSEIQKYINTIHRQMQEIHAPEHHILITFEKPERPAISDTGQSEELITAIRLAARSPGKLTHFHNSEIVVGTFQEGGITVSVSETVDNLYGDVLSEVLNRLTGFIVLAFIQGL